MLMYTYDFDEEDLIFKYFKWVGTNINISTLIHFFIWEQYKTYWTLKPHDFKILHKTTLFKIQ